MARYIDADLLYRETEKKIKANHESRMAVVDDEFLDLINDAPTEDVVEVCRCKDCDFAKENGTTEDFNYYDCALYRDMRKGDDFCNYGKRKAT